MTGEQPYVLRPFIVPGTLTVEVQGTVLDSSDYRLDIRFGRLWIPSLAPSDTATAVYQFWDLGLPDRYTRVLESPIEPDSSIVEEPANPRITQAPLQLRRSGSITRGILAGNNRDATIESGLRLQMSGALAPDINLRAALTDENTPILPEGTTQRLSELDRVFIEIETPYSSAQLGDFELPLNSSTFAKLNRKIQGVGITTPSPSGSLRGTLRMAAATSRGLFKTQDIKIQDGVQGPYRLQGNANEPFILVIPGSESVYLDGNLLTRGESQDYVIDYATGEVTFTTNRLMKYHHRVAVEFQYRTTEFTRTLIATEADFSAGERASGPSFATFGVTFIREADGKSFDQEFGLTAADRDLLTTLGDQEASRSGATPVTYDPDAPWVHYEQRDTTVSGNLFRVYVPITRASQGQVFRVEFTRVGPGEGDYVRQGQTTNGITYSYRGPGQGEYLPIRILPKPTQQRMLDLRGSIAPIRYIELSGEWAHSFRDENRFSSLDAADDRAHSYHGRLQVSDLPVGVGTAMVVLERRHTGENFATFDRVQPIEFVRSWNLPTNRNLVWGHRESIDEASITWQFSDKSSVNGTLGRLRQSGVFSGNRRVLEATINELRLPHLSYFFTVIESESELVQGNWVRHDAELQESLIGERLALSMRFKSSNRRHQIPQGLQQSSQKYWQILPAAEWTGNWGTLSSVFDLRDEHLWTNYKLMPGRRTATTSLQYTANSGRSFRSEGRLGWQDTKYSGFFQTTQGLANKRSLVLRWTGRMQPWQRLFRLNWYYEALSEQTPVLQEIYIRTGPELGEYVWIDSNDNGIIEIDEFIPEVTQDEGNYARTLIPSDSLQSVTGLKARFNIQFDNSKRWQRASEKWKRWLSHVALRTAVEVNEKSQAPQASDIYFLRQQNFRHPQYSIRGVLNLTQDLWLFRNNPQYGLEASWRRIRSASKLAAGAETRSIDDFRIQIRWRLGEAWAFKSGGSSSSKINRSDSFSSREFDIQTRSFTQEIQLGITQDLRVSVSPDYARKDGDTGVSAAIVKFPLQGSWSRAGRANVNATLELAHVNLEGGEGSAGLALFELTDGRGRGSSLLWRLHGWLQLNRVLRATISYSGRSPQDAPQIHTVRMQLSATF
ncbi:MAG: hypothetical protein OXI44_06435 [Bacteroidota bacterium]|nr:hypothetical protein [Bacteroidota bacterium]